jgi:cell division protease FtsH
MSRQELDHKIAVLLGGRAAEKLVFNELSTGASDDIAKATDIARNMVTRYGMDDDLGSVAYETLHGMDLLGNQKSEKEYSERTAQEIDESVREIIAKDAELANHILESNREILDQSAARLLENETLDEAALKDIAKHLTWPVEGQLGVAEIAP